MTLRLEAEIVEQLPPRKPFVVGQLVKAVRTDKIVLVTDTECGGTFGGVNLTPKYYGSPPQYSKHWVAELFESFTGEIILRNVEDNEEDDE